MEEFLQLQIIVNLFFQQIADFIPILARLFSLLGDEILFFLILPALYWCIDSSMGLRIGAILLMSNSIVSGIKMLVQWPRPYWLDSRVIAFTHENSFGFPSGHSANSTAVWGVCAARIRKKWFWISAAGIVLMIGISRLVLGVHFLIDVLGGWLLGILFLIVFLRLEQPVTTWFNKLSYSNQLLVALAGSILMILPSFCCPLFFSNAALPKVWSINAGNLLNPFSTDAAVTAGGIWGGFLCGFLWFRHHNDRLKMDVSLSTRLFRFAVGLPGALLLWKGLDMILPESGLVIGAVFRYLRYFLTGFWIAGAAPWIFNKWTDHLTE